MNAEQLTTATMQLFGVKRADLFSDNRTIRIAEARQALAWALRQHDWSLESIGDFLHRDHTTIIYAVKTIERRAAYRPRLAERLAALARTPTEPTIDRPARVAALEARVTELEALLNGIAQSGQKE